MSRAALMRNAVLPLALAIVAAALSTFVFGGSDDQEAWKQVPAPNTVPCTTPADVQVDHVVDGDTVAVVFGNGCHGPDEAVTVRIIGINTPETRKPRSPVQCFGPQATAFAHRWLDGKTLHLEGDEGAGERDKYDRLLAYVEVDGQDYGAAAVRAGLAEANDYGHRHARSVLYVQAQAQAKREETGAWARCPAPFTK